MLATKRGVRTWQIAAGLSATVALCVVVWGLEQRRPVWEVEWAGVEVTRSAAGDPVELSFVGTSADEATLALAAQLETVHWIDLSETRVTRTGLRHLGQLPALTSLDLSNTAPGPGALSDVGLILTLHNLRLDGCTWVSDEELRSLRGLTQLRQLMLNRTPLTARGLSELQSLVHLEVLEIDDCTGLTDAALQTLAEFPALQSASVRGIPIALSRLREVWMSRPLLDVDVDQFDLSELQPLLDHGAYVGLDDRFTVMAVGLDGQSERGGLACHAVHSPVSARAHRLIRKADEALQNTHNTVVPADDSTLALLTRFQRIGDLWLRNVKITDTGFRLIADLQNLESLSLDAVPVTVAGFENLSRTPNLHVLALSNVPVTAEDLLGLSTLTTVHISEAHKTPPMIDPNDLQRLIERRPNLSVYVDGEDARPKQ